MALDPAQVAGRGGAPEPEAAGAFGFIVLNGERSAITQARRCLPRSSGEQDFYVVAAGSGFIISVAVTRSPTAYDEHVRLQGRWGNFSHRLVTSEAVMMGAGGGVPAERPLEVTETTVRGDVTLLAARAGGGEMRVTLDLALPAPSAC